MRSKNKPIDVKTTLSSFDKHKFENIMSQKYQEREVYQEKEEKDVKEVKETI